jgi:hypothetical protein
MGIIQDSLYYYSKVGEKGNLIKYKEFPIVDAEKGNELKEESMKKYLYGITQAAYEVYKSKRIAPKQ